MDESVATFQSHHWHEDEIGLKLGVGPTHKWGLGSRSGFGS